MGKLLFPCCWESCPLTRSDRHLSSAQRLAPHTPHIMIHTQRSGNHAQQHCPHSRGEKNSSPTVRTCLEQRCRITCILLLPPRHPHQRHCGFHLVCQVQRVHPQRPWYCYCTISVSICPGFMGFKALKVNSCLQSHPMWCWRRVLGSSSSPFTHT